VAKRKNENNLIEQAKTEKRKRLNSTWQKRKTKTKTKQLKWLNFERKNLKTKKKSNSASKKNKTN
jgi:hypothetical protein